MDNKPSNELVAAADQLDGRDASAGRSPRLRTIIARLDEIRRDLDRDDLDLEDQLLLYREGCTLAAQAKKILDTTRAEVEFLMGESDGLRSENVGGRPM